MLGRRTFTSDELGGARTWFDNAVSAYRALYTDASGPGADLEHRYAESLLLSLDRWFIHRLRAVAGTDTNPLTEMEVLAAGIMGGGRVVPLKGVKYDDSKSVLGLALDAPITLSVSDVERLADAFLTELGARFAE